jgi:hypothetical protein
MVSAQASSRLILGLALPVSKLYWMTVASTGWGMGSFLAGIFFAISWEEVKAMRSNPIFPFKCEATSHINYLELFAVFWALKTWGSALMRGQIMPLFTDSTAVLGMLKNMSGQTAFIPLLKEMHVLMLRLNIRLRPFYIWTWDNVLSDTLSRGPSAKADFEEALDEWEYSNVISSDKDDWQFSPEEVSELDLEVGPFVVDASSDETGSNAHFAKFWSKENDCRSHDWAGRNIFCNLPFSIMLSILLHFLRCKIRSPLGTTATFVVPAWLTHDAILLILELDCFFKRIRFYPKGSNIFTSPSGGVSRRNCGPTKWAVWVVHCPPTVITQIIPDWILELL